MQTSTAPAPDSDEPDWLSTKQAAQLLGIPVRELYRLIDDGELAAYRLGRLIRLRHRDVVAYDPDASDPGPTRDA